MQECLLCVKKSFLMVFMNEAKRISLGFRIITCRIGTGRFGTEITNLSQFRA